MQFLRKDAGGARRAEGRAAGDVARAWLLSQPAVTAPIIGPRTLTQLAALLEAEDVELPEQIVHALDEVSVEHT